jgi:hypothetical protein
MILYVNGDSHTAGAEAVNNHAFAEDDSQYREMGRLPHPDNLAVSWGKKLADQLGWELHCDAESASSNDRIIRTTKQYLESHVTKPDLMILQWSTWEREEWFLYFNWYQVNASGIDHVHPELEERYKNFVANIDWRAKTREAHTKIWDFHLYLQARKIPHLFFNGNTDFSKVKTKKDWDVNYLAPYDSKMTYHSILQSKGVDTVSPHSYHYGADGHRAWANYILHYLIDNQLA